MAKSTTKVKGLNRPSIGFGLLLLLLVYIYIYIHTYVQNIVYTNMKVVNIYIYIVEY